MIKKKIWINFDKEGIDWVLWTQCPFFFFFWKLQTFQGGMKAGGLIIGRVRFGGSYNHTHSTQIVFGGVGIHFPCVLWDRNLLILEIEFSFFILTLSHTCIQTSNATLWIEAVGFLWYNCRNIRLRSSANRGKFDRWFTTKRVNGRPARDTKGKGVNSQRRGDG